MKKRVAILHTSLVFINVEPVFKNLFNEILPDVEIVDFIDSDVLATVNREGCIAPSSTARMVHMAEAAEAANVDLIFSACSSLGPTIDEARKVVHTPIVKIDDAMAQVAAEKGTNIGVLATVESTLEPTANQILEKAAAMGKKVNIHKKLCDGAFQTLMAGEREKHDQMVLDGALSLAPEVDIMVLAQASMSRLAPMLAKETGLEVLSSPRLAVEYVRKLLNEKTDAKQEGEQVAAQV